MTTLHDSIEPATFSEALRAATWRDHEEAETSAYMTALLAGELDRSGYAALVAQHWFIYQVLEEAAAAMADDPVARPFLFPELVRLPALEEDLDVLVGDGWREGIRALPSTAAYCNRMREVCLDSPGALVAHHYTRYLGDLSGGQHIGRVVARVYDLPGPGASFYRFEGIPDPRASVTATARSSTPPRGPATSATPSSTRSASPTTSTPPSSATSTPPSPDPAPLPGRSSAPAHPDDAPPHRNGAPVPRPGDAHPRCAHVPSG